MGSAAGFKRTEGPNAGHWFMNGYYYSFDETGEDAIDAILSTVALAGKRFHYTESWADPTGDNGDEPSSVDEIQTAAIRAASELATLREKVAELEKDKAWAMNACETLRTMIHEGEDKVAELKRSIYPARQRIAEWFDLIDSEQDLDDSAGDGINVREVLLKQMEEVRAGLLAAVDEVCP